MSRMFRNHYYKTYCRYTEHWENLVIMNNRRHMKDWLERNNPSKRFMSVYWRHLKIDKE